MDKPAIENDGADVFVTFNGVRIAKRGKPETPQARMWVSIKPGRAGWRTVKTCHQV
jgi:hypothetical protein